MSTAHPFTFSAQRFAVFYHLSGTEAEARAKAEALCLDQTVEMPVELLRPRGVRPEIPGQLEAFRCVAPGVHEAGISFAVELLDGSLAQLLNVVFGISSLKPGIRVARLDLPSAALQAWRGPRFGRAGLRARVGVHDRPLVCGVLKPLGLQPDALADLAYRLALGGLDLIKDDQSLTDQPFCPFDERVARCADAVARAGRETGRPCLYVPHVTGALEDLRRRCLMAKQAGAGGVLVCPGLMGFDALRAIASDDSIGLPILSHPAFLGHHILHRDSGLSPGLLFGTLPRLAGADVTLYPTFGGPYPVMSREDCRAVASACGAPWAHLAPIFPTAAGRMSVDRVQEMRELYGNEVLLVLGSELYRQGQDSGLACKQVMDRVAKEPE